MKKFLTSIFLLLSFLAEINATNYYVDGSKADDTGNGQSWATAKKTITAAHALGVAGDNVFVKAGTYSFSAALWTNDRNFYGGFAGTEASPSERSKTDSDNNGIVEPWEFSNQTVLNFTLTNATGLNFNSRAAVRVIDGFKITGTQTASTTGAVPPTYTFGPSIISTTTNLLFQNNIVSDITVANSLTLAYTQGSIMLITGNNVNVNNCLFEKNTVTLTGTATQNDYQQVPLIFLKASGTTARNVMQNCIVRNNKVTIDYSATALTSVSNARGLIVAIECHATYPTTLKNTIIHNNDMTFIPKTGATNSLGNAGAVTNYAAANSQSDSIINCTIAKNKGVKTGCAGLKVGIQYNNFQYPYVKVFNNVCYDNVVDGSITTTSNMTLSAEGVTLLAGGIQIANNYANGGATQIVETSGIVYGNVSDLANDNANATKGAKFTSPSTVIGYSTDATVATSRWTIGSSSYLISKGLATNSKYDKANMLFASTPSVGAYEGGDVVIPSSGNHSISSTTALKSLTVNAGGKLTLNNGVTFTVGALELQSNNDNGTATFVNKGGTLVSSSSKVQQYLTNQSWYLSSPVQGTVTPTNLTRIQGYNEGVGTGTDWSVSGTTMTAKKGYIISVNAAPNTVEFTGTINSGAVSVPLTRQAATDANKYGFNLIGNPYTAYLDWRAVATANASKMPTSTMWYRTKTSGSWAFTTVNGSGVASPANVSYLIPPMQAFWVRASTVGNSNLELTNDMVFHDNNSGNKLKAPAVSNTERQMLRLQVSNAINTDELVIYTDAQALNSFDNFDSPKMSNESADIPEISSVVDDQSLVINGLNSLTLDSPIPLRFMTKTANTFTFKANQVSNLPEGVKVILNDNGTEFDLTNGAEYNFTSNISDNTSRFSLLFRAPGVTTGIDKASKLNTQVFVNAANQITIIAPEKSNYSIYNAVGQLIENGNVKSKLQTANYKLQTGIYVVKVNNQSTKVIIK